jgi:hypothetical protein
VSADHFVDGQEGPQVEHGGQSTREYLKALSSGILAQQTLSNFGFKKQPKFSRGQFNKNLSKLRCAGADDFQEELTLKN